jgi:hypothetical protein
MPAAARSASANIRIHEDIRIMKKLSLNLDSLRVESFATAGGVRPRGTVNANEVTAVEPGCTTSQQPYTGMGAGCSEFASCLDSCSGCGGASGYYSCGNGSDCANGYTEYNTCTQNYKHCGV